MLLSAFVFATFALGQGPTLSSDSLAITNVSVIDVTSGTARSGMTVLVQGNRITAVGPSEAIRVPLGTRELKGEGKFLIPGLWDMHAHTGMREFYLPLYIAKGITGIRDMGGVDRSPPTGNFSFPLDSISLWREEIRSGRLLGPWIVAAGSVLDGPEPWPGTLGVANPADARHKVDSLRHVGADFIKGTNGVLRDSYRAIAAESKRLGIPFVGHTPSAITARDAAIAGQRSIEHLTGLPSACIYGGRCSAVFRVFVTNGTWQVPTLAA